MNTGSNIPAYGIVAIVLAVLGAIVALAFKGTITGAEAMSGIFGLLTVAGVGGGAVAVHAGVKAGVMSVRAPGPPA